EPYCSLYPCSAKVRAWKESMGPFKTFRLGGDVTQVFAETH
ncbi:MAG: mannuronate-specific alginate lyase, partial [Pseudomonas sp.]